MQHEQPGLDFTGRTEQQANLDRVSSNIAGIVADFCHSRFRAGRAEFHMADLTTYVNARSTIAPDSAGRILQDLRRRKVIGYEVISRSQSLYKVTGVNDAK
jgi:hypothetical protein